MFFTFKRQKRNLMKARVESYLRQITQAADKKPKSQERSGAGAIKYSCRDSDIKYSVRDSETQYPTTSLRQDAYDPVRIAELMKGYTQSQSISALGQKLMQRRDKTFSQCVLSYLNEKNLRNSDVYKAAKIDRRLFSKMMTDDNFQPSKDTALAVVIALRLTLKEAHELLSRAGYTLSHSNRRDIVIEYFISQEIYDLSDINDVLYRLNERIIGR